ncbi:MAG: mechanosensitive ion channel family protein [Candidatus Dormibacterales bacterium]
MRPLAARPGLSLASIDVKEVVYAAAIFVGFLVAARILKGVVNRLLLHRSAGAEMVLLTERIVYFGLILLGALVAVAEVVGTANIALTGILAATILAGLGVQDLMKNYVSGFYILFEKDIKVGDLIKFGDSTGTVTEVKARVTYLRGEAGELVIVPNSELFNSTVVVKTVREPEPARKPRRRLRG